MASVWLGGLAFAAAAVALGDVAGRRRRAAVVALVVGGVMVVACGVGWCGRWWVPGSVET